jgi:hypothetical protein
MCHGDFLNADHNYIHKNKNLKGFGSYGDMMIRDRKMYVAPTPYALTVGTERQITLIAPEDFDVSKSLISAGGLVRVESERLIRGYSFDMMSHEIEPSYLPNPSAGKKHPFKVFRSSNSNGPEVTLA